MKQKQITVNEPILKNVNTIKKFSLNLNVRRFTTDSNGVILDDATIPDSEKKPFPFHMFGAFDFSGGYNIADNAMRQVHNTILFRVYVAGIGQPMFFFNAFANINAQIKKGDVVFIYVDDLNAPNYFTFVIVSSIVGAYASLVSQSNITQLDAHGYWGVFKIFDLKYTWYNDVQLREPMYLFHAKYNSAVKYDVIDPSGYYYPEQKPNVLTARIPLNLVLNQYTGLSVFLAYENPLLNLSFEIYV